MRLGADHVRVRVPATSANLGPGFDALGLALDHHDEVEVWALGSDEVSVEVAGEGAGELPTGEDHLVVRAIRAALDEVGAPQSGLRLRCHNTIPHGRGMGSSAAAVVAGILAARMLISEPEALYNTRAFKIASAFEGHPDNAAPAILGGATVCWVGADGPHATELAAAPGRRAGRARAARAAGHGDRPAGAARHGAARRRRVHRGPLRRCWCRRCATGRSCCWPRPRSGCTRSTGRTSCRRPGRLVRALRDAGQAAVVSGAGPSVLVLERASDGDAGAEARERVLDELGIRDRWRVLAPGVADGRAGRAAVSPERPSTAAVDPRRPVG